MRSRLYRGTVMHARHAPVANRFRYGIYYVYVDLDELDELDRRLTLFGHNRPSVVSIQDADHGPRDGSPLKPWIERLLADAGIDLEGGRVFLLTFPRVLGFRFYPVSFWYCFGADGACRAILAEVQNTFRDHHNYLLHNGGAAIDFTDRPTKPKAFYISPFIERDGIVHSFRFSEPGDRLGVVVEDLKDGERVLTAAIALRSEPLDDAHLARVLLRFGPMSLRALALIHWQALKLVLKRVPFYPHTPPPEEETT